MQLKQIKLFDIVSLIFYFICTCNDNGNQPLECYDNRHKLCDTIEIGYLS